MNKDIVLNQIINWKYPKFNRRNPSRWLPNSKLQDLYDYTCGPFNSPDPVECFVLYAIAKNTDYNILEFGSWKGRSSCFIAQGIKDSANTNRELSCIDWFKGDETGGAGADYGDAIRSLKFFDLDKYATIHNQDMLTIDYKNLMADKKYDFVFYDADHSPEPTVSVLTKIFDLIENDSIICMHDTGWPISREAISRLMNMYTEIHYIDVWEGFSILKKVR